MSVCMLLQFLIAVALYYSAYKYVFRRFYTPLLGRLTPGEDLAVVFNADSLVGTAFAHALANRGFSLLLLKSLGGDATLMNNERNVLDEVAAEVRTQYGVAVGLYEESEDDPSATEIDWLRCHAPLLAVWAPPSGKVRASFVEEYRQSVLLNALKRHTRDLYQFFRAVVPAMKAHGRGVILTVGNCSARPGCGTPLHSISSGCMGFLEHYATSVATELAEDNVVVRHAVHHGICNPVVYPPSAGYPMPREWVEAALNCTVRPYDSAVCVPHLAHAIKDMALRWTPHVLLAPLLGRMRRKERKALFGKKKTL